MFRSAPSNALDEAVAKCTDENLVAVDWGKVLDICDQVAATPAGAPTAIASLVKRLFNRNANVQLLCLELANSLSLNGGAPIHRELASKAFTDALLRLAADRNTHAQVKQKVVERMEGWTEAFRGTPELGIMEQAYQRLRTTQPGLQAPSKPVKREISSEDRRKEDEELAMALALSVQDRAVSSPQAGAGEQTPTQSAPQQQPLQQQGTTAATVSRVRALYDFVPSEPGELAFVKNDIIAVLESVYKDWWKGSLHGQTGIFPLNYVEKLADPTPAELERDARLEAEVFGEMRNVEKLLALLSVPDNGGRGRSEAGEEEIGELYQRTLSIRPKLIELIGKYSQKKDEFTQLNEKFIKARRDYEHLLEGSMAAPPQQYQQQQYPVRARQTSQPMYAPQQQPQHQGPYGGGGPPQGYPPQGPPSAHAAYPPQQAFASQSQQHLPQQQPFASQSQSHLSPQQDVQRFYSPAPSEPPGQQRQSYASPYPEQNGPPAGQPLSPGGAAPFHFIPGGLQAPPQQQQQQQQQAPPAQHEQTIRRKPSPQAPPNGSGAPYRQLPPGFQGQIRPNSIHTLNSGNPQELATSGYESPVDNRHSYPPVHALPPHMQQQQQQGYPPQTGGEMYAQQQQQPHPDPRQAQQAPPQPQPQQAPLPRSDREALPSRQRVPSFESPTSLYSQQQQAEGYDTPIAGPPQQQQLQAFPPPQPSGPPPGVPGSQGQGGGNQQPPQYQAFSPGMGQQPPKQRAVSEVGDPGEFYR
ncbi:ESCRT-0 subunit protein hse1 [Teratosphaeriaceae sp. CCFEE 6253]|nr:ESCRT-0 subunit protein hse1 [Teratosphaeriaceae sp. CCFEE 6253]